MIQIRVIIVAIIIVTISCASLDQPIIVCHIKADIILPYFKLFHQRMMLI